MIVAVVDYKVVLWLMDWLTFNMKSFLKFKQTVYTYSVSAFKNGYCLLKTPK